jgi:hypothetical protein
VVTRSSRQRDLGHGRGSDAWSSKLQECIEVKKARKSNESPKDLIVGARVCTEDRMALSIRVQGIVDVR